MTNFIENPVVLLSTSDDTLFCTDMGQNPVFENDGTNVFHFDYENENEFITLELFNRNLNCIGKSK